MNENCYRCHTLTDRPVMSGAGVDRRALCPDCHTLTRAVSGIDVAAIDAEVGPLTRRLVKVGRR